MNIPMRLVVARYCSSGIGDHIACILGAWWFAKRTGRTLVIDWRGSRFNSDPLGHHNCFHDYFETVDHLDGVPTIADETVSTIAYPTPIYPAKWTLSNLASRDHVKHTSEEIDAVNRLVSSQEDRPEPTVAFNQWVHPLPPRDEVRRLLRQLRFAQSIRCDSQRFWDTHIGDATAIGIHVRHGNGENIGSRAAYWLSPAALTRQLSWNRAADIHRPGVSGQFLDNMPPSLVGTVGQERFERRFCERIAREVRTLADQLGARNAKPLLLTDAPRVVTIMRRLLPDLVALPKLLLADGAGPLHQIRPAPTVAGTGGDSQSQAVVSSTITKEMYVELDLLRRCRGLVCMESGFSAFSRVELDETNIVMLKPTWTNRLVLRLMRNLVKG